MTPSVAHVDPAGTVVFIRSCAGIVTAGFHALPRRVLGRLTMLTVVAMDKFSRDGHFDIQASTRPRATRLQRPHIDAECRAAVTATFPTRVPPVRDEPLRHQPTEALASQIVASRRDGVLATSARLGVTPTQKISCDFSRRPAIASADPPRQLPKLFTGREGDQRMEPLPAQIQTIPCGHGGILHYFGVMDVPVPRVR
jgi:hypothetical protein